MVVGRAPNPLGGIDFQEIFFWAAKFSSAKSGYLLNGEVSLQRQYQQ
jgi:hypothetical protein